VDTPILEGVEGGVSGVSRGCREAFLRLAYYRKNISYSMHHLNPSYFPDIRTVLINRLPNLTDTELEIIIEIFMTSQ
jgi:hypothetical protein